MGIISYSCDYQSLVYGYVIERVVWNMDDVKNSFMVKLYIERILNKNSKYLDAVERALAAYDVYLTHTSDELRKMKEYQKAADNKIIEFIKMVRNGGYVKPIEIAKVSDIMGEKIKLMTGINTVGNRVILDMNTVNHIDKRHGMNGIADHSMSDDRTLARIGYVLDNYDGIVKGEGSNYVRLANGKCAPTVVFYKKVDGIYYVVEAVTDAKSKSNRVISAYISENKPI